MKSKKTNPSLRNSLIDPIELKKLINTLIQPVMETHGLAKVKTHNHWAWFSNVNDTIFLIELWEAAEKLATYPSGRSKKNRLSLCVQFGIYFEFVPIMEAGYPATPQAIKKRRKKHGIPEVDECHMFFDCKPPDIEKEHYWHINQDMTNLKESIEGIKNELLVRCLPLFNKMKDLKQALIEFEKYQDKFGLGISFHDCTTGLHLARKAGNKKKEDQYWHELMRQQDEMYNMFD